MHDTGEWIAYLDETVGLTSAKGWITVPTITVAGTNDSVSVASTGSAIVGGAQRSTPSGASFTGFANSTDYYVSYDVSTEDFAIYTSWDAANADDRVPVYWFQTTAGGLVGTGSRSLIPRRIASLGDTYTLTVAQDASQKAQFTTLKQAISFARALQKGSTLVQPGITIEVIGDVLEPASLDEKELYDLQRVRFVGRAGRQSGGSADARILFSASTLGLFHLLSSAAMVGWSFENLTFQFSGSASVQSVGVVTVASGTISKLKFVNCLIYSTGVLPKFIYGGGGNIDNVTITDCQIQTSDAMIHMASGDLTDLTVRHTAYDWSGSGPGTVFGGIVAPAGNPARWRVESCKFGNSLQLGGSAISAREIKYCWIKDNSFEQNADAAVIDLGNATSYDDVEKVWIHDNLIRRTTPASAIALLRIRGSDESSSAGAAMIFIHSNAFIGDDASSGAPLAAGIQVLQAAPAANSLSQIIIHSNSFTRLLKGVIFSGDVSRSIVSSNAMYVKNQAFTSTADQAALIVSGNSMLNASGASLDINTPTMTIVGNYTNGTLLAGANALAFLMEGNHLGGGTLTDGIDNIIISGNLINGGFFTNSVVDLIVSANFFSTNLDVETNDGIFMGNQIQDASFSDETGQNIFAANRFTGAVAFDGNNSTVVANKFEGAVTIDTADNGVFDANYLETTLTINSGATGWVVEGNAIVGVFQYHGVSLGSQTTSPNTTTTNKRG